MKTKSVIIGGGPAGSCVATLLAKKGIETILLEKSEFPRFHIGESLLPASTSIFRELGVLDEIRRTSVHKPGGCWYYDGAPVFSHFADCRQSAAFADDPSAFMVERARFDKLLLDNAEKCGADVRRRQSVCDVHTDTNGRISGLTVEDHSTSETYELEPEMVFDCSGYHALVSRRMKIRDITPLRRMAIFAHFEGDCVDERVTKGWFVGEMIFDGWVWLIPLGDNKISVGVVTSLERYKEAEETKEDFIDRLIHRSPMIRRAFRTPPKRISDVHLFGNLGYSSRTFFGPNWTLVGDAAFFIDPCYSSGVHLALSSAKSIAETFASLHAQPEKWPSAFATYEKYMRRHERLIGMFVECFYMASRNRRLRKIVPFMNSRKSVYLDFVEFTGGDFSKNPRNVYGAYFTHKLVSSLFRSDPTPEYLSKDAPH